MGNQFSGGGRHVKVSNTRTDVFLALLQRAFLMRAIDAALDGYRWAETCYEPTVLEEPLRAYRALVDGFVPAVATTPNQYGWPTADEVETRCPVHRIHCSDLGECRVCVDC